ncbi:MAG: hypothetical protein KDC83_14655 [Flavobacteriales bacterium]|nr:hypothetical protein [Flavobacteriales bacterium]
MIEGNYYLKYQACNLCDALHRNVTDNFLNISFEVIDELDIQVKFIMKEVTELERDMIDDIMAEFSSKQLKNCVRKPVIVSEVSEPLKNVLYNLKTGS